MVTRAELHQLIGALPDAAADEAALQLRLLALPEDDEPTSPEDQAAIAEAEESIASEGTITLAGWPQRRAARAS